MLERKNWKPESVVQLAALILFALSAGSLLTHLIASVLARFVTLRPDDPGLILLGMALFQVGGVAAIAWFLRCNATSWVNAFGLHAPRRTSAILLGVVSALVLLPVCYLLLAGVRAGLQAAGLPAPAQQSVSLLLGSSSLLVRGCLLVVATLGAPLIEEMLFRGVFFTFARDLGYPRVALLGSSLLFGMVHFNLAALLPLAVLGIALARLYERSGSLLVTIAAHATFNLVPFIALALGFKPDE